MSLRSFTAALALPAIAAAGILSPQHAAAVSISGEISQITGPIDLSNFNDPTGLRLLVEKQNVQLATPLSVHFTGTGDFDEIADVGVTTIPAGTVVSSYYVVGNTSNGDFQGSIVFDGDEQIVAVIGLASSPGDMGFTNAAQAVFGLPDVTYPSSQQGIDIPPAGGPDVFSISPDAQTLTFDFSTGSLGDDFRIITVVPEPASAGLLGAVMFSLASRRRR